MNFSNSILTVNDLMVMFESPNGFIRAVDKVSFTVKAKTRLSIIGESGSGKTAMLLAICNILNGEPGIVSGQIYYESKNLLENLKKDVIISQNNGKTIIRKNDYRYSKMLKKNRAILKSKIAMVFQDPRKSLDPLFTIEEQMLEAYKLKNPNYENSRKSIYEAKQICIEWLNNIRIDNPKKVSTQYPNELSGGMLQRVMIAISMIIEPSILISDEPTTALDIKTTNTIMELVQRIYEENNLSIIFVTHDIGLAEKMSDEIIVMNSGQIVEYGSTKKILGNHYNHPYTEALLKARLNPFTTNRSTPVSYLKDRSFEELYLNRGCKFRLRCSKAKKECETIDSNIQVSDDHGIFCRDIEP